MRSRLGIASCSAADHLAAVEVLAAVAVAVDREEDLRLDLGEAVDDAGGAEVGRAARPDRADARRVARKATIASGMFGR